MLSALLLVGTPAVDGPFVTCVLVEPPGATPWGQAADKLDATLKDVQWWYSCQMEAYGYGAKTFALETDSAGKVVVHIAKLDREPEIPAGADRLSEPASGARSATIIKAETVVGDPRARKGTVMMLVYDGYYWTDKKKLQVLPMGFGADGRWAHVSGWHLYGLNPKRFTDETPIRDLGIPNSFLPSTATKIYQAEGDGNTVGSRASGSFGTFLHEMGHSFGLHHPTADDPLILGDVMTLDYWGGARGNLLPGYDDAWCCLTPDEAATINKNPLFQVRKLAPPSTGATRSLGAKGAFNPKEELRPRKFATIALGGSGYTMGTLGRGQRSQSNRDYVWKAVPAALEGYKFTMAAGGVAPSTVVQVLSAGRIYVATASLRNAEMAKNGWQIVPPTISYMSTDGKRVYPMYLYAKEVRANTTIQIPQYEWTGTIVIVPSEALSS